MYIKLMILFCLNSNPDKIYFTKDNLNYDPALILAAVAEHECLNLSWQERHLVMEAVWNRVIDNYNNNGCTIQEQLLAPKQFTGLFIYRPQHFYIDKKNKRHIENIYMALCVIQGHRLSNKKIYYWSDSDNKSHPHYKYVKHRKITTSFRTIQIFR